MSETTAAMSNKELAEFIDGVAFQDLWNSTGRGNLEEVARRLRVTLQAPVTVEAVSPSMSGWVIVHADGKRWRTLDSIGMPDWTDDPAKALCLSLREHADAYAADDPEDVRIVPRLVTAREQVLRCQAVPGGIDMSIGVTTLQGAAAKHPEFWDDMADAGTIKVIDPQVFAVEVVRAINDEGEDGSTLLTRMLDKAIANAVEQGCEGVDHDYCRPGWVRVPFQAPGEHGLQTFHVLCPNAPKLTACGLEIKTAAGIGSNYTLHYFDTEGTVGDAEACELAADGSTRFIGVPPATMGGSQR